MFTGAHDKLVDKCMFTTVLMQLKAAVLVRVAPIIGSVIGNTYPLSARFLNIGIGSVCAPNC